MSKPKRPLLVVVTETEFKVPAILSGKPTLREIFLALMLNHMGGVNENTEPGTYDFDVKRKGLNYQVSLTPSVYNV